MILVEVKPARKQEKLQFHVFYASPEGPLVGTIPFHKSAGTVLIDSFLWQKESIRTVRGDFFGK